MRAVSAASDGTTERARPHRADLHVGQRLRLRRTLLGLSQGELGRRVGLTFQQIQKYERGANRIGASRLVDLAAALGVAPAWFFEEIPVPHRAHDRKPDRDTAQGIGGREALELIRLFNQIKDRRVRERILALVRAVAMKEQTVAD
ncbi:MAG: helix-turn-helix transcriptional regulator [Rhodospirillales bacterium]|nr:helix-turn-helix transcriptional regulator [Rhodospirillales bacterium]